MSSVTHFYALLEEPKPPLLLPAMARHVWKGQPVKTLMTIMDSPTRLLRYNRSLPARANTAWGRRTITNQNSLFDIVRATPPRSAGYLYVRAYLVSELIAELFAEQEGERS